MQRAVYFLLFFLGALVDVASARKLYRTQDLLINFVRDNLDNIITDYNRTDVVRQMSRLSAGYEIGFIVRSMEECYRRMVDIYNSSLTTGLGAWQAQTTDYITLLKHIEMLNWVIDHLTNMLHETEKKYKIKSAGMFEIHQKFTMYTKTRTRRSRSPPVATRTTTKRHSPSWWPIDYGWELKNDWRGTS